MNQENVVLQLNGIKKDYETYDSVVKALKGIDLSFRANEFVAILGPSGCGKTTLLNIIGGLDRYTDGDLIINGRSTKKYSDKDWDTYRNHSIGFVFQTYNLIPHLTVLGNVELSLTLSGVSFEERRRRAIEVLNKVGLHDQINKKPNQMSGGQMQRVAIARALINDPDIILADEPTGALDTETSIQVMDILKEISKNKLIIMVTHNPDIANKYANRIVRVLDGKVVDDTNPCEKIETLDEDSRYLPVSKKRRFFQKLFGNEIVKPLEKNYDDKKKPSMSFFTALNLSFRNLRTKIARTILVAFAGSIGIIGIALVLSLSNGFQKYIDKIQVDTMSSQPLSITETTMNLSSMNTSNFKKNYEKYTKLLKIFQIDLYASLRNIQVENKIDKDYIENVIEKLPKEYYNAIQYGYGNEILLVQKQINPLDNSTLYVPVEVNAVSSSAVRIVQEMLDDKAYNEEQYDIIAGRNAEAFDEVVLFVNEYNQIPDYILLALGLSDLPKEVDGKKEIAFEDILNQQLKIIYNDDRYQKEGNYFKKLKSISKDQYDKAQSLKIVGIMRLNKDSSAGYMNGSLGYTKALTETIIRKNKSSELVKWLNDDANKNINPFTGSPLTPTTTGTTPEQIFEKYRRMYGAIDTPSSISIYPKSFETKNEIKNILDKYNENCPEDKKVIYLDIMSLIMDAVKTAIDAISYVLIAFTSVSLIVSSIMIAVITYISVLERTKEIGVLRSIGASKLDISRVFNAETIIIGFISGVIGVVITVLLDIPINLILKILVDIPSIAKLSPIHGIILVIVSVVITLIAGLVPSIIAAKRDPVTALRSE